MNITTTTAVLNALSDKPYRLTVIASGAGAGIQFMLWNRAGASSFLTGAYFPYDRMATQDLLGFEPKKAVSGKTAVQMAVEAYIRSCRGAGTGEPLGLGLTAAVSTNRERKGANVVDVALITPATSYHYHLSIEKELRRGQTIEQKRINDGQRADAAAFRILSHYLHAGAASSADGVESIRRSELMDIIYENPLFLPNGQRPRNWQDFASFPCKIPISANPPHEGHYGIAREMAIRYNAEPLFTVTADSVHKPSLSGPDLLRRVAHLRSGNVPVLLTRNDPLFIDKARQFPNSIFGIGADTLERMLDPRWSTQPIGDMLSEFHSLGTRFMVFDRDGKDLFSILGKILPSYNKYNDIFVRNPKSWDVSSSRLRATTP